MSPRMELGLVALKDRISSLEYLCTGREESHFSWLRDKEKAEEILDAC